MLNNGDTLKRLFREADEGGYAVPMFNYTDLWDLLSIVEAANELHAPVMVATIPKTVDCIGPKLLGGIGEKIMEIAKVPVIHHLDHANEYSTCKDCIDNNYPSVMIDASKDTLEGNIRRVKEVVEYAHPRNVCVEAEIGKIKGRDYEGTYEGDDFLVNVQEACELVKNTNVDSLAVGIGTAHGFYQGKPEINFKRLAEVNEAISIPLVLHGGTGIPEEDVRKAIKNGINKVNVGTQIRFVMWDATFKYMQANGVNIHTIDLMADARKAVKEVAKTWIKVCMADGKA